MSKISEDTAKRSITMFESLVKDLVNETNTFVKKNKTNGLTTPALKRKANSLLEELGDQFKRMKNRWDGFSSFESGLEANFEALLLKLNLRIHKRARKKL